MKRYVNESGGQLAPRIEKNGLKFYLEVIESAIKDQKRFSNEAETKFVLYARVKIDPMNLSFDRDRPVVAVYKGKKAIVEIGKDGKPKSDQWFPYTWFDEKDKEIRISVVQDLKNGDVRAVLQNERRYEPDWSHFAPLLKKENESKETGRFSKRYEQALRQMALEGEDGQSGYATEPEAQCPNVKMGRNNLEDAWGWEERLHFEFPEMAEKGKNEVVLYPTINLFELEQRRKAVKQLLYYPAPHHAPLKSLFRTDGEYPTNYPREKINEWYVLTDEKRDGAREQREFVEKALSTPDFAILEGPPGSGKTTAILELVLQLVSRGKRVLLASATHVAIDNVLERLLDPSLRKVTDNFLLAARVATNENRISNEEVKYRFSVKRLMERQRTTLQRLIANGSPTDGQKELYTAMGNDEAFERFVLEQCNLIAGTTAGLLAHPVIKNPRPYELPFDCLIVDEASKVPVDSFLVPALLAQRWVLVGDVQQLSPYSETDAIADLAAQNLKIPYTQADQLTTLIERRFSYRFNPNFAKDIDKKLREQLYMLNAEQITKLEVIRRASFPSILEALQLGVGMGDLREFVRMAFSNEDDTQICVGMEEAAGEDAWDARFVSLTFQNRMAEEIARIPRQYFYDGQNLITARAVYDRPNPLKAYRNDEPVAVWQTVDKDGDRNKNTNADEAKAVLKEIQSLEDFVVRNHVRRITIAVLAFYRGQERMLRKELADFLNDSSRPIEVRLSTVDRFQGQEADAVLLCFTKWSGRPFYNAPNRLNVALTRARHKLVLFGNPSKMTGDGFTDAIRDAARTVPQRKND
jgi:hypothetical protein